MTAKRARVWNGTVNKWVFASLRYRCPLCKEVWGGADGDKSAAVGDRVCDGHTSEMYEHLPKKLWPRSMR